MQAGLFGHLALSGLRRVLVRFDVPAGNHPAAEPGVIDKPEVPRASYGREQEDAGRSMLDYHLGITPARFARCRGRRRRTLHKVGAGTTLPQVPWVSGTGRRQGHRACGCLEEVPDYRHPSVVVPDRREDSSIKAQLERPGLAGCVASRAGKAEWPTQGEPLNGRWISAHESPLCTFALTLHGPPISVKCPKVLDVVAERSMPRTPGGDKQACELHLGPQRIPCIA